MHNVSWHKTFPPQNDFSQNVSCYKMFPATQRFLYKMFSATKSVIYKIVSATKVSSTKCLLIQNISCCKICLKGK